jgi:HK97 family phage portal protein
MLNLFRRLRGATETKASAATRIEVEAVRGQDAIWTPRRFDALIREGYEQAVWAYACVGWITRLAKDTRWIVFVNDEEADRHPLLDLLKRPNPQQGGSAFIESIVGFNETAGNAYIERVGLPNRAPVELWVKRPDRMRIIPDPQTLIRGYEYEVGGQKIRYDAWQIRHLRKWNPSDDWYGLSPLAAAARGIDTFNGGQAHNLALIQNGARPSGAWVTNQRLTDQQFSRLREQLDDAAAMARRGRPMLVEDGTSWQELGLSPRDLDFLAGQEDAARQIHAAFGVHPVITGLSEGTFENQKQALRSLTITTVLPFIELLTEELNAWLAPLYGPNVRLAYDRDAYSSLAEDQESLWTRAEIGYKNGFITRNEARHLLGYEPVEDGDEFAAPAGGGIAMAPDDEDDIDPIPDAELNDTLTELDDALEERSIRTKSYPVTSGMRDEARRGLAWREEFGRGGTEIGVARARDISNGRNLSLDTVRRMASYFARHEVDKQGTGFTPGEDGFPSAGRIAWALWGGDPGQRWARAIIEREDARENRSTKQEDDTQRVLLAIDNPTEYQRNRTRLQITWENRFADHIRTVFQRERERVAAALATATPRDAIIKTEAALLPETEWNDELLPWVLAITYAGGTDAYQALTGERIERQRPRFNQRLWQRLFGIYFQQSLEAAVNHTAKLVGQVHRTTLDKLSGIIGIGVGEGLSMPAIAALIDTLYLDQILPDRSIVIARTETIRATNRGSQDAALATGLDLNKVWIATDDDRTRPAHLLADRQITDMRGTFTVDGEELEYPGDPNGSAGNVIQCRCTVIYEEKQ